MTCCFLSRFHPRTTRFQLSNGTNASSSWTTLIFHPNININIDSTMSMFFPAYWGHIRFKFFFFFFSFLYNLSILSYRFLRHDLWGQLLPTSQWHRRRFFLRIYIFPLRAQASLILCRLFFPSLLSRLLMPIPTRDPLLVARPSWAALLVPHIYTGSTSGGSFSMGCTSGAPYLHGIHFWWLVLHGLHFWCPISTRDPLLVARSFPSILFLDFIFQCMSQD